jgi:hypothetical protein
MSLRE